MIARARGEFCSNSLNFGQFSEKINLQINFIGTFAPEVMQRELSGRARMSCLLGWFRPHRACASGQMAQLDA